MINFYKNLKNTFFILFLVLSISIFLINGDIRFDFEYKIKILLIIILNIFPIYFISKYKKEKKIAPIFQLILIYYFICYTTFFCTNFLFLNKHSFSGAVTNVIDPDVNHLETALSVFLIGLTALNFGYFVIGLFLKNNSFELRFLDIKNDQELLVLTTFTNFTVLFFYYFFNIQNYFPALSQIKFVLVFLSIILNIIFITKSETYGYMIKFVFFSFILILFYLEILEGSYAAPFLIIIFSITIFFHIKKKVPLLSILFTIVLFLFFHSFKYEYRSEVWNNSAENTSADVMKLNEFKSEKLFKTSQEFINSFSKSSLSGKIIDFRNRNIYRIHHSAESLLIVTALTPKEIPYWDGHSYKILISKLIPRVFWKNKPSDTLGNDFGHRYRILNDIDKGTSWNMPVMNEFYVNYGILGVVLGMSALGILFRLLVFIISIKNEYNYHFIAGFAALFPIFFLESHLSLVFGAIFQTYLFSIVYLIILKKIFNINILKFK